MNPLDQPILMSNWMNKSVLIVEDSHSCFKYFTEALKRTGVLLTRAETGPEALEICCRRRQQFDLIMVDIQIPFINGIEVIREIRRQQPGRPVIAITAYSSNDIKQRCFVAGCYDYLVKPVTPGILLRSFRAFLEPNLADEKVHPV